MFSLKLDLLFPTVTAAKEIARKLNERRRNFAAEPHDPRELQRINAELRAARDRLQLTSVLHRNRIL